MKPKPILFSTSMVTALLDGRKTQTRRVIKPQPIGEVSQDREGNYGEHYGGGVELLKPRYQPGDNLWVRETWQKVYDYNDNDQIDYASERYVYAADDIMPFSHWIDGETGEHKEQMPWRPSIHMPYAAARIFLRVTDVRVERLQDIMNHPTGKNHPVVLEGHVYGADFIAEWQNTMNKKDWPLYGWDANPWVYVYEFERCEKPQVVGGK